METVQSMMYELVDKLTKVVEDATMERLETTLRAVFGDKPNGVAAPVRRPVATKAVKAARKKPPVQYCPVPKCHEVAAPVFKMLCRKHKGVSKKLARKYREARAARKAQAA